VHRNDSELNWAIIPASKSEGKKATSPHAPRKIRFTSHRANIEGAPAARDANRHSDICQATVYSAEAVCSFWESNTGAKEAAFSLLFSIARLSRFAKRQNSLLSLGRQNPLPKI
jgi:hypothetical protein